VRFASRANERHGVRITNADKRARVENALREFEGKPARTIADICGVHHQTVINIRGVDVSNLDTSPFVTDSLGRKQPATKPRKPKPEATEPAPAAEEIALPEPAASEEPAPRRPLPGQQPLPIAEAPT